MNPDEVPVPLEKSVKVVNGVVEVTIAEKKMTDKEKKVYKKFMAKCVSGATGKSKKDAMLACAVDFEKMKEKIMAEDDLEEIKKEEEEDEDEEEKEEEGKSLEEKIKLEKEDIKKDKYELELEKQDLKDDEEYLKDLEKKKKMEESKSAAKKGAKMEYREKQKTPANSVGIITVDQINKWEKAEKNENQLQEQKETKTVWKNTIDL